MKQILRFLFPMLFVSACVNPLFAQWVQTNGPHAQLVQCLAASGENLFAGTYGGGALFLSTDKGASWTQANSGLTDTLVFALAVSPQYLFAGTNGGGIFLSSNEGASWNRITRSELGNATVRDLMVSDSNILAATVELGVYTSTNAGITWIAANAGLPSNIMVYGLANSATDIFAATNSGVFLSSDTAKSWVGAGLTTVHVNSVAESGGYLFAGTAGSGIFRSTNKGANWTQANSGLPSDQASAYIDAFAVIGSNIFAGTEGDGVFLSTDNGANWVGINSGLTAGYVLALLIDSPTVLR